jgi:hypothetical protein
MKHTFWALLAILVLGSVLLPEIAWAKSRHVRHHKVRHVRHHHHHRTGA